MTDLPLDELAEAVKRYRERDQSKDICDEWHDGYAPEAAYLLLNHADALIEAARKAKELERAEDCASAAWQREAERLAPLVSSQQARAEIAEREVAALKEELAGNVRRESAVIDQQTPPDDELRLIIQVEEEGGTVSLLAIVAKRLLEARRLVRWHMAIGGEYEALQAENAALREAQGRCKSDLARRIAKAEGVRDCAYDETLRAHADGIARAFREAYWIVAKALTSPPPKSAGTKEDER